MEAKEAAEADAVKRAYDILSEHFPAFILVTEHEDPIEPNSGATTSGINLTFSGGFYRAMGLMEAAKKQMLHPGDEED